MTGPTLRARASGVLAARPLIGSLHARGELISFAAGAPHILPQAGADVRSIADEILGREPLRALQYTGPQGFEELRERLAALMAAHARVEPGRVIVTAGCTQALDLVAKVVLEPGDLVLTDSATFPSALSTFALYGAEVGGVEGDAGGMDVDALAARLRGGGRRPRLIYTMPTFSNPTGATLSLERRTALAALCEEAGVLVVEDDTYGPLRFDGDPVSHLAALCPDHAIYLGSVSKSFLPGLRVGWLVPPAHLVEPFLAAQELTALCVSPLAQLIVAAYLASDRFAGNLAALLGTYRERRDALLAALEAHLSGRASWSRPQGGLFVWVEFAGLSASALLERALAQGVAFVPGEAFSPWGGAERFARLSFSSADPERIARGVGLLAAALAALAEALPA